MTGNRLIRNNAPRLPGEKPVINERVQYYSEGQAEIKQDDIPSVAAEQDDEKLKEGIRLFLLKRWEQALNELLLVDASNCNDEEKVDLAYYMGLCCAKMERYDDALLYLEQVVASGGDLLRVYQCRMTIAYIYVITGRPKMAEFELKRLQSAGFESAPLFNTLAYASYSQKRYRHAIEFYEKVLEIDMNNTTALNSMGYILADQGIDPSKGLRLCRKAVDKMPQNAAYLASLGWAHYKCGDMADARNWLRRAFELAPAEKEIENHFRIVSGGIR
jgi:tetratricopeptide (TPR) repeat protein